MTRFQRRFTSCEYIKTKKKKSSDSFVSKNKVYETRSGGLKGHGKILNGVIGKNICINALENCLELRHKVYVKSMETSIIVPPKNRRKYDLNSVALPKSPPRPRSCVDPVKETTKVLLENTFDDILRSKLKMNVVEGNCIISNLNLEEIPAVRNGYHEKEVITEIESPGKINPCFQNIDFHARNVEMFHDRDSKIDKVEECNVIENFESLAVNTSHLNNLNSTTELYSPIMEKEEDKTLVIQDVSEKLKVKKVRRSRFEFFFNSCSEIGISLHDKRKRRAPNIFKPTQKKNYDESPRKHSESVTSKDKLEKNTVVKRKCGRKPKLKGPIFHYLDLYVQNIEKCDKTISSRMIGHNICSPDNTINSCYQSENLDIINENIFNTDVETPLLNSPQNRTIFNSDILHVKLTDRSIVSNFGRRKISKKNYVKSVKGNREVQNCKCSLFTDKSIDRVLGYRIIHNQNEVLVLFKNGTSNWVKQTDLSDDTLLENIFQAQDQELSIMNRIPYRVHVGGRIEKLIEITELDKRHLPLLEDKDFVEDLHEQQHPSNSLQSNSDHAQNVSLKLSDDFQAVAPDVFSTNDMNYLCDCVISSKHIKLYPHELNKSVVVKSDGEFMHVYLKQTHQQLPQRFSNCLDLPSCSALINILEDCDVSEECQVVVISGVNDFFASSNIFEKLLRNSPSSEIKSYEEDVSMVRYLVQTICNFSKPIVAVIKRTGNGLPASLLSLFDMVFDEHTDHTLVKNQPEISEESPHYSDVNRLQNHVFPRIMGLAESNVTQMMGERRKSECVDLENIMDVCTTNSRKLTVQLTDSVKHMHQNGKLMTRCLRGDASKGDATVSSSNEQSDDEEIQRLKDELNAEKDRYMTDLESYLKCLNTIR